MQTVLGEVGLREAPGGQHVIVNPVKTGWQLLPSIKEGELCGAFSGFEYYR